MHVRFMKIENYVLYIIITSQCVEGSINISIEILQSYHFHLLSHHHHNPPTSPLKQQDNTLEHTSEVCSENLENDVLKVSFLPPILLQGDRYEQMVHLEHLHINNNNNNNN